MLLRASSEEIGASVDLRAAVEGGDGGVKHGALLAAFAEAATRGSEDLPALRSELLQAVGPAAFVEAASTVGAFNGLVRTADATGIPLDDGVRDASQDIRAELGLNEFSGSRNTDLESVRPAIRVRDVLRLFS